MVALDSYFFPFFNLAPFPENYPRSGTSQRGGRRRGGLARWIVAEFYGRPVLGHFFADLDSVVER